MPIPLKAEFESVDLEINGPPEEKIDILFLAEGYTEHEMEKFLDDAEDQRDISFRRSFKRCGNLLISGQ